MKLLPPPLPAIILDPIVRLALSEDLGRAGDLTTDATIAPETQLSVVIAARQPGVIAAPLVPPALSPPRSPSTAPPPQAPPLPKVRAAPGAPMPSWCAQL